MAFYLFVGIASVLDERKAALASNASRLVADNTEISWEIGGDSFEVNVTPCPNLVLYCGGKCVRDVAMLGPSLAIR